ncbi:MAG: branched-chain amino acid transporter permease [Anaerovoracaceae bacterium]|jgi:branched-subunit amino acid transport protein AzlD
MTMSYTAAMAIIAVVAGATFFTRLVPFALFGRQKEPPKVIKYLGGVLPPAVIAILVVYCLRNIRFTGLSSPGELGTFLPPFLAIGIVVLLHLWKRNNLLSIGGGTVFYMILVQFVFV